MDRSHHSPQNHIFRLDRSDSYWEPQENLYSLSCILRPELWRSTYNVVLSRPGGSKFFEQNMMSLGQSTHLCQNPWLKIDHESNVNRNKMKLSSQQYIHTNIYTVNINSNRLKSIVFIYSVWIRICEYVPSQLLTCRRYCRRAQTSLFYKISPRFTLILI